MEDLINLDEMERDAIKEVGNIGTGNAATALSKLLKKHVEIIIPETKFIPIKGFADEFGGPEFLVTSTYLEIFGDLNGEALFIFPIPSAKKMVTLLLETDKETTNLSQELSESAFKEMSNIFAGAYLNSLANLIDVRILPNIPQIKTDMLQSILDFMLVKVSNYSDTILSIKTKIEVKDIEMEGYFIIIFDIASINKLLHLLKKMYTHESAK